jgi:cell wall-associated NlpC family hydrolase
MPHCPHYKVILTLALATLFGGTAFADSPHVRRVYHYRNVTVYRTRPAHVSLQPFSFNDPLPRAKRGIDVAYYAPQTLPRARRAESEDTSEPAPEIQSRGSQPTVAGSRAVLRNGVAYAPANAPEKVKSAIWAVNTIRSKPYHWGGGHGSFSDSGYDCSGTVSFALHHAGVLNQPLPSSDLQRFGERGRGRWITIYARSGHTFANIAGLRLDTTDFSIGSDVGPRWHNDGRDTGGFSARHPAGL